MKVIIDAKNKTYGKALGAVKRAIRINPTSSAIRSLRRSIQTDVQYHSNLREPVKCKDRWHNEKERSFARQGY